MDRCADDVESYLRLTAGLDFARKASLFYKANVNYLTSAGRELIRADPDDLLGFVPRSARDRRIGKAIVEPIAASEHDLQVHIHHEYYTFNDTPRDPDTFAYLQTPHGRSFDDARLELAIRLGLDTLREDGGVELSRWFFIHGHWALNGSDPHECNVVREIEILQRNGCLGDFTQPAGRVHVDSRIDVPYLVDPAPLPKGYDTPASNPTQAAGAGPMAAEKFFIWASATTHRTCSIDTYSPIVQQRLKNPEATALDHARSGVVIDGVLYLKTHCHSLHPIYCQKDGLPTPHADPGVQAELRTLFAAADRIGADVRFLTATEVYDAVVGARTPPARDLVAEFQLSVGSAMEPIGVEVDFTARDGSRVAAPPLAARPTGFPAPSLPATGAVGDHPEIVSHIIPVISAVAVATEAEAPKDEGALINAALASPLMMAADDVQRVNAAACDVALERIASLGAEASGVTGFYGPRARQRQLLQAPEVLCANLVQTCLPDGAIGVRNRVRSRPFVILVGAPWFQCRRAGTQWSETGDRGSHFRGGDERSPTTALAEGRVPQGAETRTGPGGWGGLGDQSARQRHRGPASRFHRRSASFRGRGHRCPAVLCASIIPFGPGRLVQDVRGAWLRSATSRLRTGVGRILSAVHQPPTETGHGRFGHTLAARSAASAVAVRRRVTWRTGRGGRDETWGDRMLRSVPYWPPGPRRWGARRAAGRGLGGPALRAAGEDPLVLAQLGLFHRARSSPGGGLRGAVGRAAAEAALGDLDAARRLLGRTTRLSQADRRLLAANAAPTDPAMALGLLPTTEHVDRAACALAAGDLDLAETCLAAAGGTPQAGYVGAAVASWRGEWRQARSALNHAFVNEGMTPPLAPDSDLPTRLETFGASPAPTCSDGPLVSVVIAARDAESTLAVALGSLIAQTWRTLELILVDDGSQDGTLALARSMARSDPRIRVMSNRRSPGAYGARNTGIEAASGRFIGSARCR